MINIDDDDGQKNINFAEDIQQQRRKKIVTKHHYYVFLEGEEEEYSPPLRFPLPFHL